MASDAFPEVERDNLRKFIAIIEADAQVELFANF
jgi:hypothetical protein